MRAFVVRSFGTKAGVNFERVQQLLIGPALESIGAGGGTTGEIVEAGNIREDMFEQLVAADLVIADVSVHNANVFYELGVRHAVRGRATVLIRADIHEVPFDLRTDRYLDYDPEAPDRTLDKLVRTLRSTLADERDDSPVFRLLPRFAPAVHSALISLPRELGEDIEQAAESGHAGDLRLIANEIAGLRFEQPALRAVAKASARAGDDRGALEAWERIRRLDGSDLEANQALANIYRRLGSDGKPRSTLTASDQAIDRAISNRSLTNTDRAELHALQGSNSKRRWVAQWRVPEVPVDRQREALRSRELELAYRSYQRGFTEDLNHFYSGLNALALARIGLGLAERFPTEWLNRYESDPAAERRRTELRDEASSLEATVRASLDAHQSRQTRERSGSNLIWLAVSRAELLLLSGGEPERVASAYAAASSPTFGPAELRSIRDQLVIYRDLDVFTDAVNLVLDGLGPLDDPADERRIHPLVFAGHMIDDPDRPRPRFPAEREDVAKAEIHQKVADFLRRARDDGEELLGLAGASNGGDILFHEVCRELDVKTHVMLPLPELVYRASANARHAARWSDRYHQALRHADEVHVLSRTEAMPGWLVDRPGYTSWQRQNRWMLYHAWSLPQVDRVWALALWNGRVGDGLGGVAGLVATAQELGAEVTPINTTKLFGIDDAPIDPPAVPTIPEDPAGAPVVVTADEPDPQVVQAWRSQQILAAVADHIHSGIRRRRATNLVLLVSAALLGAVATQPEVGAGWSTALTVLAAALLAIAAFIQSRALTAGQTAAWLDARIGSEALKSAVYRYLAHLAPFDAPDRVDQLRQRVARYRTDEPQFEVDSGAHRVPSAPLPRVQDLTSYLTIRAQGQADWHRTKSADYASRAKRLRTFQLVVTLIGVVLAAAASVQPTTQLSAWTAAATTVAAAVGAHLAASQYRRLAISFASAANQLDDAIAQASTIGRSTEGQTHLAERIEEILAAQNGGWAGILTGDR